MSTSELLKNLKELQAIDKEIYGLKKEIREMPEKVKALDREINAANILIKEKEEAAKKLQLKRKEKEIDLEQKEGNIKKLQAQLYQIKTNKEYTAMDHEIAGFKADKSLLEEDILIIFDEIESADNALKTKKKEIEEKAKKIEEDKKILDEKKKNIEIRLAELEKKRKSITPSMEKDTLHRYEKILQNKEGVAFVPVVGENCGGCFVNLPPQIINEIRLKDKIIFCERCARMLYADE